MFITESQIKRIVRKCLNEAQGVYYDGKLISKIINKLYYMIQCNVDSAYFKYDGYEYSITFSPFLGGNYFAANPNSGACCKCIGGQIEIGLNPKLLNRYKDEIMQYKDYGEFVQSKTYDDLEARIAHLLAHEITHAQEFKHAIDTEKANGGISHSNTEMENGLNEQDLSDLEKKIIYYFNPRERQARLSQGYVVVKRQLRTAIKQFGDAFVESISVNDIYNALYEATETNLLDTLYQLVASSPMEELAQILTHKSPIFSPKTNNLRLEHKRLVGRLEEIMEYNKKKLIKVIGRIKEELNARNNGKRF